MFYVFLFILLYKELCRIGASFVASDRIYKHFA